MDVISKTKEKNHLMLLLTDPEKPKSYDREGFTILDDLKSKEL